MDLTGGLYDAGDNVKFNLPMSYTASVLAWSVYENRKAYEESGQLEFALSNIKWIDDYLIKCHTGKEEYYYQVGDGNLDHAWWGPAETMMMERPSYKVDSAHPGSTVTGEAAAALAAASVVFKESNPEYAKECLQHSKELYDFSAKYLSDDGYTMANGFYSSFSGFYDELSFAAAWLYLSTGEESYKNDALKWFQECDDDYKWTLGWDDVHLGTALIMGRETKDKAYLEHLENNLDYWTTGVGGEKITYTPKGLAWLDSWGSLRYASSAAFLAYTYAASDVCPAAKKNTYHDFAVSQINYCLGSTGSAMIIPCIRITGLRTDPTAIISAIRPTAAIFWRGHWSEGRTHRTIIRTRLPTMSITKWPAITTRDLPVRWRLYMKSTADRHWRITVRWRIFRTMKLWLKE